MRSASRLRNQELTWWLWSRPSPAWVRPTREKAKSWNCVFSGGLTVDETAEVLQISGETVMRDWSVARAWLLRELDRGVSDGA